MDQRLAQTMAQEKRWEGQTMNHRTIGVDIPQGWAVLDVRPVGQSDVIALGELEPGLEPQHFTTLLDKYKIERVAIETPLQPYAWGRGAKGGEGQKRAVLISLIACSHMAGRIEERSRIRGIAPIIVDADTVRRALGISGETETDRDRAVKACVKMRVRGWPKQSNKDERDAACVAIYGGLTKQ